MPLAPVFTTAENWQYIGEVSGSRSQDVGGRIIPPPILTFPFLLHQSAIAIIANCPQAEPTWDYAGKATILIRTGIVVGGNLDSAIAYKKLWLRQVNIFRFDKLSDDFKLIVYPPKWFPTVSYSVFEYIGGGVPDSEAKFNALGEKLDNIQGDLTTLHNEFDAQFGIFHP